MHIREYLAALELANDERARMDLPALDHLPAGTPRDPLRCAIANAVPGAKVTSFLTREGKVRRLSRDVLRFVQAFDRRSSATGAVEPGALVDGGIEDDKGCLVGA
jgi:hypothetical protein